jgi:hypothetical protein
MADAPETTGEFEERRKQSIWELISENDHKYDEGHKRLRKTIDELSEKLDILTADVRIQASAFKSFIDAPVEAAKIRFSTQALYIIVGVTITIVVSVIGSAASVRSDMRNINTRMDADSKLADQRYGEIKDALARQEQQRREDKAAAEVRLKKYDNDELLRDLRQQGVKK